MNKATDNENDLVVKNLFNCFDGMYMGKKIIKNLFIII